MIKRGRVSRNEENNQKNRDRIDENIKDGDPNQTDETPDSFKKWLSENPDTLKETNEETDEETKLLAKKAEIESKLADLPEIPPSFHQRAVSQANGNLEYHNL